MNPLINAYQYKINQLNEQIQFILEQNYKLRLILNESEEPFPGYGGFPPGGRRNWLRQLWESYGGNPNHEEFNLIREMLRQLNALEWNSLMEDAADEGLTTVRQIANAIIRGTSQVWRNFRARFMQNAMEALDPGLLRRFSKLFGKGARLIPGIGRLLTILLLLLANADAYGDDFSRLLEKWLAANEGNPNADWPDWAGPRPPELDDLIPSGLESDDETPSMLPNADPYSTTNTAPGLPGGGGGTKTTNPIDPDLMI
jgi:hypothetical protein